MHVVCHLGGAKREKKEKEHLKHILLAALNSNCCSLLLVFPLNMKTVHARVGEPAGSFVHGSPQLGDLAIESTIIALLSL